MKGPQRIVFVQSGPAPARDVSLNRARTLARSLGLPLSQAPPARLPARGAGVPAPGGDLAGGAPRGAGASLVVTERDATPGTWYRGPETRARSFIRGTPCSVWLLAPDGPPRTRVVVAAAALPTPEPDALDLEVVAMADALARAEGARLLVVHGWSLIGESIVSCPVRGLGGSRTRRILVRLRRERQQRLESLLLAASPDAGTRWILAKGSAADALRTTLTRTGARALVMGYRGRLGPWGTIRGNLAEDFLAVPGVSLMAVRPMEWAPATTALSGDR